MCTLILGRDVVGPETVLLAANRDEDPGRPTDPPGRLAADPRVVGGRDRLAGGTWLAVRGREAAVAILNRRGAANGPSAREERRRSRGLLALDVATAAAPERLVAGIETGSYAPFTLLFASPAASWRIANGAGAAPRAEPVGPGWHVVTHQDLDDRSEPRTARVLDELAGFRPRSALEAIVRAQELLRSHDAPPVCLHEGRMITVSSSIVWLARGDARYLHAEGRPCEHAFADLTPLLDDAPGDPP